MAEKRAMKMKTYRGYRVVDGFGFPRGVLCHKHSMAKTILAELRALAGPGFGRIARIEVREIIPATKRRRA